MSAGRDDVPPGWKYVLGAALLLLGACGDDPAMVQPGCEQVPPVYPGEPVESFLSPGDATYEGGYIDYHGLRVGPRRTLRITLASAAVEPFLYLFDADATVVAQAFAPDPSPPGETETAVLIWTLAPGCHMLGATSWVPGSTGRYRLLVEELQDPPARPHRTRPR
ncbi:MAG: hypothetical protein P8177_13170 [Gemmatimonadota bacterium]